MGKGSSGSSQRAVTPAEQRLWDSQATNLDAITKIAEDQYKLSVEDREYYEKVFRDGTDTDAKEAVAKLRSQITGTTVDPSEIQDASIDTLLRDTILNSTPEFQRLATEAVDISNQLTTQYGSDITGLSNSFSQGLQDLSSNYSSELQTIKEQTGTINQDVLSRETGASMAGISQAYSEARKQMLAQNAMRGLAGSGVEQQGMASMYQQEAMTKANAGSQARTQAYNQSEAMRQQQMGIAGSQLQAQSASLQSGYQAQSGAIGNVYGVQSANIQQGLQTTNAGILQGIGGLTQAAQAGQGIYAGSQNYLSQAGSTAGQAAQIAGNSAAQMGSMNDSWTLAQQQRSDASSAGIGQLVGTLGGAALGGPMGASIGSSIFGG